MCRAVTCKRCGKAGWAGCGAHVEQVLADVPATQRCSCAADTADTVGSTDAARSAAGGLLSRLFGRSS